MPGALAQLGLNAAQGVIGAGMGLLLEGHNDRRQIRQQQKLQDMQIAGNKELSQFNQDLALKMWKDTNYSAQMDEIEKAGLSPGLIYGMSGGGGATAQVTQGNVSGGRAPEGGRETIEGTAMGLQLAMMKAQINLAESQANKNNVEATKTAGVDTTQTQAQTASLMQGITNAKAQEAIMRVDKALKDMELKAQGETYDDRVDFIMYNTRLAMNSLDMAANEQYIQRATMNAKIDTIRTQAITAVITNAAMNQKIAVDKAQISTWATQLSQGWEGLDKREKEIRIQAFKAEIEAKQPGLFNVLGGVLSGAMDEISDLTTGRDQNVRQEKKINLKTK